MSASRLREIMTQAVVGQSEQTLSWCHQVAAGCAGQVFGVRIGQTAVRARIEEGNPVVQLTVDCDLWCGDGEESVVLRTRCRHAQATAVPVRGRLLGEPECCVRLISGPRSSGVRIEGGAIYIDFEATVQVEVMAVARLWVAGENLRLV